MTKIHSTTTRPRVLCLSGFDPSGGAGIQADIESISSMGAHAVPVITALTVQDTRVVQRYVTVDTSLFIEQLEVILEDICPQAIKIGMVSSHEITAAICQQLKQLSEIPLIYDPVLSGGGGGSLSSDNTLEAVKNLLLPHVSILTPNSIEARALTQQTDLQQCGLTLLKMGCEHVLITGGHEKNEVIDNLWFSAGRHQETFSWQRLPNEYHGSGCTLAAATAALMAQGLEPFAAINEAQEYSWNTLQHAFHISDQGQLIPDRFYWTRTDDEAQ